MQKMFYIDGSEINKDILNNYINDLKIINDNFDDPDEIDKFFESDEVVKLRINKKDPIKKNEWKIWKSFINNFSHNPMKFLYATITTKDLFGVPSETVMVRLIPYRRKYYKIDEIVYDKADNLRLSIDEWDTGIIVNNELYHFSCSMDEIKDSLKGRFDGWKYNDFTIKILPGNFDEALLVYQTLR